MADTKDPLVEAAAQQLSETLPWAQSKATNNFYQDLKDAVDISKKCHPSEQVQIAAAIVNSAARNADTDPGIRDQLLKLMKRLDGIADSW
jgi:hypothetical protein